MITRFSYLQNNDVYTDDIEVEGLPVLYLAFQLFSDIAMNYQRWIQQTV